MPTGKYPIIREITSGYGSGAALAYNFSEVEQAFENTLSRDGSEPNQMEATLDMNSNDIINVRNLSSKKIFLNGQQIADPDTLVAVTVGDYVFPTRSIAAMTSFPVDTKEIVTLAYDEEGDLGGTSYVRVSADPGHTGAFRSVDRFLPNGTENDITGGWWDISGLNVNPIMFGAKWDYDRDLNVGTDDTVAINNCASFCRDTYRTMYLPPNIGLALDTLYLGGLDVQGEGNARAGGAVWAQRSSSILRVGGQPGIIKGEEGQAKVGGGRWRDFEVVSALTIGNTTTPIDLWDRLAYPYQIGVNIGRSLESLSSANATADGTGFGTIENVSFRGFNGWGLYGHMCWGLSSIHNCTFHEVGGPAAVALGDRNGGAMVFDNTGVDWDMSEVHGVNWGYSSTTYQRRGTFLRLGSFKTDTDTRGRVWTSGGNVTLDKLHAEGWAVPLDIRGGNDIRLDNLKLEGQQVYIGEVSNGADQPRVHMGRWSNYSIENGFLTVNSANAATTDLGFYQGFQSNQSLLIKYKGTIKFDYSGSVNMRHNFNPRPSLDTAVIFLPDWDTTGASSSTTFTPWVNAPTIVAPTEADNLLPVIPNPVSSPYAFGGTGVIKSRVGDRAVRIARGAIGGTDPLTAATVVDGDYAEFRATVSGLIPGELHSFAFRADLYTNAMNWDNVSYGITNVSSTGGDVLRFLGQNAWVEGGTMLGTVSIENGETIVTGDLVNGFSDVVRTGDRILLGTGWYTVAYVQTSRDSFGTITKNEMTITIPYRGTTLVTAAWDWEGESIYTSRVCNFTAPPSGNCDVFIRVYDNASLYVRDMTVVLGPLVDYRNQA